MSEVQDLKLSKEDLEIKKKKLELKNKIVDLIIKEDQWDICIEVLSEILNDNIKEMFDAMRKKKLV